MLHPKRPPVGFLYLSLGPDCEEECHASIESLLRVTPDADITVFSDSFKHPHARTMRVEPMCPFEAKLLYMGMTPYERTFFVDTDTYFYHDCSDGFRLLDFFDLCISPAPIESEININGEKIAGAVPSNTGVVLYRRTAAKVFGHANQMLRHQLQPSDVRGYCSYCKLRHTNDQAYLMLALMRSEIKTHALPNTWNLRLPSFASLKGPVRIVHSRRRQLPKYDFNFETFRSVINATDEHRMWNASSQTVVTLASNNNQSRP